jgi:hypothetical protein
LTKNDKRKESKAGFVIYSGEDIMHTPIKVLYWKNSGSVLGFV